MKRETMGATSWDALLATGIPEHALLAFPERAAEPEHGWQAVWAYDFWRIAEARDEALRCRGIWKGRCPQPVVAVLERSAHRWTSGLGIRRRDWTVRAGFCADHLASQWQGWVVEGQVAQWQYRYVDAEPRPGPSLLLIGAGERT